jgi:hypothetical protein
MKRVLGQQLDNRVVLKLLNAYGESEESKKRGSRI